MYYCAQASGTIISLDAICSSLDNSYYKFGLESNLITGHGTMTFESPDNTTHTVTTVRNNGLWFLSQNVIYSTLSHRVNKSKLNKHQQAELWSLRLGCPGETQLTSLHHHATGIPTITPHKFSILPTTADANSKRAP